MPIARVLLSRYVFDSCAGRHLLVNRRGFHWVLRVVDVGGYYGYVAVELRHFYLKDFLAYLKK